MIAGNMANAQQLSEEQYQKKLKVVVDESIDGLISDAQPNTYLYQVIFGPCLAGQLNGEIIMRKTFYNELNGRLQQRFPDSSFFLGRAAYKVRNDAARQIDSVRDETNDRLRLICRDTPERMNRPPKVYAGDDQLITLPVSTTKLTARGKDPDGDILTYHWTRLSGKANVLIISQTSAVTNIENLEEGEYQFVVSAADGHDGFAYDTVTITVNKAIPEPERKKIPPVANAGDDLRSQPGKTIILNGSGTDADGNIVSYEWRKVSGNDSYNILSPSAAITEVNKLTAGEYEFELTVMDNDGLKATDRMILRIDTKTAVIPPWVWILIGLIVLGGASYTYYYFWWWRQRKKLIVYFMNKGEEALANELMPDNKKTEGYCVGHATRHNIKKMKKEGLALRVLNTELLTVNTPGVIRRYKFSVKKGAYVLDSVTRESDGYDFINILPSEETLQHENELPAFYIITLDAPLLPVFNEQLEAIGLPVLQRVPYNSYIIRVNESWQLEKLHHNEEFRFIRMIKQYTAEDTGFTVRKDHYDNSTVPGKDALIVIDLVLHRQEDIPVVNDFLSTNGIERIGSYRNTIRIRIRPDATQRQTLAANNCIQAIYEHIPPVLHNDIARQMIGIDAPLQNAFIETGEGETIAVADTGIDQTHPDLANAIIQAVAWGRKATNDTSDPHGHGTHVTGTIVGNGKASGGAIRGIAPGAKIFFQSLLDDNEQLCDLGLQLPALLQQAYDHKARILNISWGAATESYYTLDSAVIDQFVFDNQDMLVVVSAGNEAANRKDKNGNAVAGFGTVGSPATTKNGLAVGASNSKRMNGDFESMAAFSSKGPCKNDRRIKPDIVAPGTNILSAKSKTAPARNFDIFYENTAYVFLGGTSMATPVVSGAAAMVREYYRREKNYPAPSAALIKATLMNGTRRLTGTTAMLGSDMIPNNNQGYGMLNMLQTIPNKQTNFKLWYSDSLDDRSLEFNRAGEARMWRLVVKQESWLRVCLVFIDNPRMGMQSDLNLIISQEGTTSKWRGNAGINLKDQFYEDKEEDFTNNIEIVRIENAAPGNYLIEAVAENAAPDGKAGFALVVTTNDMDSKFSITQL